MALAQPRSGFNACAARAGSVCGETRRQTSGRALPTDTQALCSADTFTAPASGTTCARPPARLSPHAGEQAFSPDRPAIAPRPPSSRCRWLPSQACETGSQLPTEVGSPPGAGAERPDGPGLRSVLR